MSSPVRAAVLIFSLLGIFHGAVAEAPGDQDATCRTGLDEIHHIFPEEWEVLVDSYDYRNLYGEVLGQSRPVWRSQGFDEDGLQVIIDTAAMLDMMPYFAFLGLPSMVTTAFVILSLVGANIWRYLYSESLYLLIHWWTARKLDLLSIH